MDINQNTPVPTSTEAPIPAKPDLSGLVFNENKKGFLETTGLVTDLFPSTTFQVELANGHKVLAHLSGKMRINKIRILPGDEVILEISPYDLTKGRITRRN